MSQYFQVGEEVILCSSSLPELNCETVVKRVVGSNETVCIRDDGVTVKTFETDGPMYILECDDADRINRGALWKESALRKKHQPGEDFKSLMSELTKEIA